jgi:hypothetical protein
LLLVTIAIAAVAAFSKNIWGSDPQAMQQKITQDALKQAKEALLAYVEVGNRGDLQAGFWTSVNGRLPCPNTDGGGTVAGSCGTGASVASGVSSLGLFPWRTFDIPIVRDGSSECLWYAVSGDHKNGGALASRTEPTNADTNGLFTVIQPVKTVAPDAGVVTWIQNVLAGNPDPAIAASPDRVVAVIIAPGSARTGQMRTPAVADVAGVFQPCALPTLDPATGNPSAELSAPNYLDAYANGAFTASNNSLLPVVALAPRIFVQADKDQERLNDQMIWITADEFAKAATKRTAHIFAAAINNFVTANGFYPPPAAAPGGACDAALSKGFVPLSCPALPAIVPPACQPAISAIGLNLGTRLNADEGSPPKCTHQHDANVDRWLDQTHYAVNPAITVNGIAKNAVLLMRGRDRLPKTPPILGCTLAAAGVTTQANLAVCVDATNSARITDGLFDYFSPVTESNDLLISF